MPPRVRRSAGRGCHDRAQLVEASFRERLARRRRRHAEDTAEARAEVAVVREAGFERERGQVAFAVGEALDGRAPDNRLFRWTFSEITPERVRWQGFVSSDEGRMWIRDEEIVLRRRS